MAGHKISTLGLEERNVSHMAVKEVVFPFSRFPGVDTVLGPEMRSTGEVMGIDVDFDRARAKSLIGAGVQMPLEGRVFISLKSSDKEHMVDAAKKLIEMGFSLVATSGTANYLRDQGVEVETINKVLEGRPHIVDALKNGDVQMVFNTTEGAMAIKDSRSIRVTALQQKIPCITTAAGARSAVRAIDALKRGDLGVTKIQDYFQ